LTLMAVRAELTVEAELVELVKQSEVAEPLELFVLTGPFFEVDPAELTAPTEEAVLVGRSAPAWPAAA